MSVYQFKLPDIGEGIAEAEIVAWHVKVGDKVEEDQQLADMMTDKATVEMEWPVAGRVIKLAGEVGDQIAIGRCWWRLRPEGGSVAGRRHGELPGGTRGATKDEAEERRRRRVPPAQEQSIPSGDGEWRVPREAEPEGSGGRPSRRNAFDLTLSPNRRLGRREGPRLPAVRARARDLGIDLAEVKISDRVRHADLDAYLLYNGGSVSGRGAAGAPTRRSRSSACAARSPRICRRRSAGSRTSPWSRNSTSPISRRRGR